MRRRNIPDIAIGRPLIRDRLGAGAIGQDRSECRGEVLGPEVCNIRGTLQDRHHQNDAVEEPCRLLKDAPPTVHGPYPRCGRTAVRPKHSQRL